MATSVSFRTALLTFCAVANCLVLAAGNINEDLLDNYYDVEMEPMEIDYGASTHLKAEGIFDCIQLIQTV